MKGLMIGDHLSRRFLVTWLASRRGFSRSAYCMYFSPICCTDSSRFWFFSFMSTNFSLRIGSEKLSLAVLFAISSIFLYFFWRAVTPSRSMFFLILPKTLSVSRLRFSFSRFLRSPRESSICVAIFSRSFYLRERSLSVS